MTELLPPSIADARFRAFDDMAAERLAALPLTSLLVYVLDTVEPTALPWLAWQFRALGPAWLAAADDDARRSVIRRVLIRRHHRGTHWAVEDGLDAAGFTALSWDGRREALHDGEFAHNGAIFYGGKPIWEFWVVVVGEPSAEQLATIEAVTREWQRRSLRFRTFWVDDAELLETPAEYHALS